jgi:NADH dehydrogenase
MDVTTSKTQILILGGGFAGAYTAHHLEQRLGRNSDVDVALVARENFVLFTPMLHEVAGSDVADTHIVQPLRKMLRRTRIGVGEIESINLATKTVRIVHHELLRPHEIIYEQLVLALGAVTNFYHTPGLEEHALTMKTLGDAIVVRNQVIDALELADNQLDDADRRKTLTVVVAGGGFAGVETAGAVNDLLRSAIKFYRHLNKDMLCVVVVHAGDHILPELGESLGHYAVKKLSKRGVEIRLKTRVTGFDGQDVSLDDGTKIATRMLIWTAGVTPAPLVSSLPCANKQGRIVANECLQVPDWPGVWTLGDCALVPDPLNPGKFYPPTAQHAIRQAAVLARNIVAAIEGRPPVPFRFKMIGALAAIGRHAGVAEVYGLKFSGLFAWWMWRGIYLFKLPGFQKKVRVMLDWTLDLLFSKEIVQLPTLKSATMSSIETPAANPDQPDNKPKQREPAS